MRERHLLPRRDPRVKLWRLGGFFACLVVAIAYSGVRNWRDGAGGTITESARRLAADPRQLTATPEWVTEKPANGTCTAHCDAFGGPLSIIGAWSGQCDCEYQYKKDAGGNRVLGSETCEHQVNKSYSCCGSLDNGGGVVICLFVTLYTFLGIAIICDDYFCESLDLISEKLGLSEDVAGATFMAAGSSAPELFTALVTILLTGGSEGLGAIVGSAVFNMMIIVGLSVIFAGQPLKIAWYPLSRDCIVYVISIVMMLLVMIDKEVQWWEGFILVLGYCGYIYLMVINKDIVAHLEAKSQGYASGKQMAAAKASRDDTVAKAVAMLKNKLGAPGDGGAGASGAVALAGSMLGAGPNTPIPAGSLQGALQGTLTGPVEVDTTARDAKANAWITGGGNANPMMSPRNRAGWRAETDTLRQRDRKAVANKLGVALKVNQAQKMFMSKINRKTAAETAAAEAAASAKETEDDEEEGPPTVMDRIMQVASLPLTLAFKTVPDCRDNDERYMGCFVMSIVWIGLLSFIMVDFAARIGCILGIPGLLMGLIVLAAGTSVPDALSSILVAKNGQGDMAIANVLGSNVFNIFLGLGLPWMIKALIDGKPLQLPADEPIVSSVIVLLLFCIVFIMVVSKCSKPTKENPWILTPGVGYYLFASHFVFIGWNCLTSLPTLNNPIIKL